MNNLFLPYQDLLRLSSPVFATDGRDIYIGSNTTDWWNRLPKYTTPEEVSAVLNRPVQLIATGKLEDWWGNFLNACYDHAVLNTSGKLREHNIVAVHPFYDELEGEAENKARSEPISRLDKLLRNLDRQAFGRLLYDSPSSYGRRSHELVDEGLIDGIIFSETHRGLPLDPRDLEVFNGTTMNFVGGAYEHACLDAAIRSIQLINPLIVRPIKDAILPKPKILPEEESRAAMVRFFIETAGKTSQEILALQT